MSKPAPPAPSPGPPSTRAGPGRPSRVIELDALRGLGAMMIVSFHLWPTTFFFGWTRADLFFVLSGYLITSIILAHDPGPRFLFAFWARRALRIWPSYYLMLAVVSAVAVSAGNPPRPDSLIAHLTFTQNLPYYWSGTVPPFPEAAVQTWSLAIEEQFYLAWPLILALFGRSLAVPIALVLITGSVSARAFGLYPAVALARCDGLALGAILAAVLRDGATPGRRRRWLSPGLASAGVAALALIASPVVRNEATIPGVVGCGPLSIFAVNVVYFSTLGLVVRHAGHPALGLLRNRALCYLGQISYGVFLYHLLILDAVTRYVGPPGFASNVTAILMSVAVAAISWECFERPIGSLKTLFPYDGRRPSRPTTSKDSLGVDPAPPQPAEIGSEPDPVLLSPRTKGRGGAAVR